MFKIMIVEDDRTIAGILNEALEKWGYDSFYCTEFSDITKQFLEKEPSLVLMDISLPYYNGYYWCSEIRKYSKVPILFISSHTGNMDLVMAINMGGDDFITKPFDLSVVTAKIQALLRRTYSYQDNIDVIQHRGVVLNLSEAVFSYHGEKIGLTKNEFRILKILFEKTGKIVSREELMKQLWDEECFIDDNTLTVNVARLRKKLSEAGLYDFIVTKKGLGYLILEDGNG